MSNLFSGKMVDSTNVNLTAWRGKMRKVEYFSKMPRRNAEILARKKTRLSPRWSEQFMPSVQLWFMEQYLVLKY
jgi:hypothetical protein